MENVSKDMNKKMKPTYGQKNNRRKNVLGKKGGEEG